VSLGLTLPVASCDPVVEALAAYAAGEGEAPERTAVAEHLDDCDHCRAEHAASEQLHGLLQGAAPITGAGGEDERTATDAGWGRLAAALATAEQEAEPVTVWRHKPLPEGAR